MVQAKQHKSRAKKQPQAKKQGKEADITQFRAQLDALGLKIVHVTADGNCFFRALADQLEGNEDEHGKYRSMVVQYIQKNSEMFEPFVEDEVPFEEYCKSMGNDGTWAGHMELQAASLVTCSNICIHRNQSPRWYIQNFDEPGVRMIHLSYHDGEHYNSVRLKEDTGSGPARPIIIKADSNISSSSSRQVKAGLNKSKEELGENTIDAGSIKLVMAGTGCENVEKAKQTLLQMEGDVDAAIEYLVAGQGLEDFSEEIDQFPSNHEFIGHDANGESEEQNEEPSEVTYKEDPPSSSAKRTHDDCNATHNKKISRNKACPCGSKKKYKSCCGSGMGSSTVSLIDQSSQFRKGRNEKKRGKRGGLNTSATLSGSDVGPPDMGALCI